MATLPGDRVTVVLDAVERIMKIFRMERAIYLAGATSGMMLFLYAVYLMITAGKYDATFLGLVFGSGGIFAAAGGAILLLLNKTFAIVKEIVLSRQDGSPTNVE